MNDHIIQERKNSILYNQNPVETIQSINQQSEFRSFLHTKGFIVRESFLAVSSNNGISVIAFDLLWRVIFSNSFANEDLAKKEAKPIGTLLENFAPLICKPNSEGGNFKLSWEELARNGLFVGLRFKSYLLLGNGIINLIVLTGSPLYDNSGDVVGGVCLYKKN